MPAQLCSTPAAPRKLERLRRLPFAAPPERPEAMVVGSEVVIFIDAASVPASSGAPLVPAGVTPAACQPLTALMKFVAMTFSELRRSATVEALSIRPPSSPPGADTACADPTDTA